MKGAKAAATLAIALALLTGLAGCGPAPTSRPTAGPVATASIEVPASGTPAVPASPAIPASPVTGVLLGITAEGLTQVKGFRLRTDDGQELAFEIGTLENGVEFPPGHLAEHLATGSPIRVFFRAEGGRLIVHRIEDAST
ncbi:MAG: hypothetical protein ACYC65_06395 [Candidatus Limnocylindrales bacterium]